MVGSREAGSERRCREGCMFLLRWVSDVGGGEGDADHRRRIRRGGCCGGVFAFGNEDVETAVEVKVEDWERERVFGRVVWER